MVHFVFKALSCYAPAATYSDLINSANFICANFICDVSDKQSSLNNAMDAFNHPVNLLTSGLDSTVFLRGNDETAMQKTFTPLQSALALKHWQLANSSAIGGDMFLAYKGRESWPKMEETFGPCERKRGIVGLLAAIVIKHLVP